ncbi:MAG TPA: amidohydrolase family protein [Xanthobacteraceae bacterium]|jgi:cytosine/adenosine deaminase-related metal-dependent hydrolase
MVRPHGSAGHSSCSCHACNPTPTVSRRQFLSATAAGAVAAASATGAAAGPARAQQPSGATGPGRATLIKGGCVLSLDRAVGDFERADVLVEGGKISAVRPDIVAPDADVIDAAQMIVMPGFVDTHRHMWQGILRNVLPDGSLEDYIAVVQKTFGAKYTPDDVYAGDYFSALGAIDSGVTCILDWSHIHNTPEHSDAAVKALGDSGVRAVFAYGNAQTADGRWWDAKGSKYPNDIARLRKQYFSSDDQLMTLFLAAPSGAPEQILPTFKAARDVGARITIHVGVGERGRAGLLEKLHAENALRSDTTYIHCCTLNDAEWKLIRDTGGTVSIASYVETLMGHGHPPIQKALDTGIRPSLSVDVETSVPNDFFQQMRTVLSLQKNDVWARRLAGDKNAPKFLTVREVLEFATVEGARANGLERKIGSLTPGKDADIVLLRTDRLNVMPLNNAVGAVVTSMGPQNVDTVLIAGKVMKRNGQLVGVDYGRLARMGNEARDRLYANANVKNARI